jgi:hypothetical protein
MINEKGLSADVADKIWGYVQMHGMPFFILLNRLYFILITGNADLINQLRNDQQLSSQKLAIEALNELELLFRYLTLFNVMDKVIKIILAIIDITRNYLGHLRFKISSWFRLLYRSYIRSCSNPISI